jgi:general secretion pathway protein M
MNATQLRQWWEQRAPREKWALQIAAVLMAAAMLWMLALAPALRTLGSYDTKRLQLDAQLQTMLHLQAQALQSLPRLTQATASQALRESVQKAFDKNADIAMSAGNATVTLRGVSADTLAQWLAAARTQAHSAPLQASLSNTPTGWSGTVQMALPTTP